MRRLLAPAVLCVALLTACGEDPYRVRAIFDNAGFVIEGEDVKVAGVRVGRVAELGVTEDFKAAVTLEIEDPGYRDFRSDATCQVRPQGLIGERFVECTPTQPRSAGSSAPPPLRVVDGARLLPVENTLNTVDLDLVGNIMREPERERLSLILNELGTGLAGRGRDLNEVLRRANPALRETDRVLEILARQNTQLEQLAVNSDRVLAPLARDRAQVAGAIRNSGEVAQATAERREALAADLRTLPAFLDELEPTVEQLGTFAEEATPVLADLGARADDVNAVVRRLGPFSRAALPSLESLGDAARSGTEAITDARPVIADLRALAKSLRPVAGTLGDVLTSFEETDGIERAMDFIFYQATAINGFDALGHYLRAGLIVNQCVTYTVTPVAGCSAKFPEASADATASAASVSDDPVLRATAAALTRALGGDLEPVVKAEPTATATPVPSPAPSPTPAPAAPAPEAALLDYLFGGDG